MKHESGCAQPSRQDIRLLAQSLMAEVLWRWPEDCPMTQLAETTPSIPDLERKLQGTPDGIRFGTLMSVCRGEAQMRLQTPGANLDARWREVQDRRLWEAMEPHWPVPDAEPSPTLALIQEAMELCSANTA